MGRGATGAISIEIADNGEVQINTGYSPGIDIGVGIPGFAGADVELEIDTVTFGPNANVSGSAAGFYGSIDVSIGFKGVYASYTGGFGSVSGLGANTEVVAGQRFTLGYDWWNGENLSGRTSVVEGSQSILVGSLDITIDKSDGENNVPSIGAGGLTYYDPLGIFGPAMSTFSPVSIDENGNRTGYSTYDSANGINVHYEHDPRGYGTNWGYNAPNAHKSDYGFLKAA